MKGNNYIRSSTPKAACVSQGNSQQITPQRAETQGQKDRSFFQKRNDQFFPKGKSLQYGKQ